MKYLQVIRVVKKGEVRNPKGEYYYSITLNTDERGSTIFEKVLEIKLSQDCVEYFLEAFFGVTKYINLLDLFSINGERNNLIERYQRPSLEDVIKSIESIINYDSNAYYISKQSIKNKFKAFNIILPKLKSIVDTSLFVCLSEYPIVPPLLKTV